MHKIDPRVFGWAIPFMQNRGVFQHFPGGEKYQLCKAHSPYGNAVILTWTTSCWDETLALSKM